MWIGVLLACALIVAFLVWSSTPKARRQRRVRRRKRTLHRLEREYARLLQMPVRAARETTARVMREMARDFPDRSPEWHLRKLISDLQRDRR